MPRYEVNADGTISVFEDNEVLKETMSIEDIDREIAATTYGISDIDNFKQRRLTNLETRLVELNTMKDALNAN